jgi:hypothetical protein
MSRNEQSSACNTSQDIPDALASSDIRDPLRTDMFSMAATRNCRRHGKFPICLHG